MNNKKLNSKDIFFKRVFDIIISLLGLLATLWIIVISWLIASIETKSNGFFIQQRVGQDGKIFSIIKIKTMTNRKNVDSMVTTLDDTRITRSGMFFRRSKIDELPQLINILLGDMSFVGPRPDVSGYADKLNDSDKIILLLRPGITGPATLKYKDEETLLASKKNPEKYNNEVIYPDKVKINKDYVINYSFSSDLHYIFKTIFH
jgi:lipopolysaccharide/colanic/teichoic acid biosynthesis glycosyltransferase